ncbi:hypothetical protein CIG75_10950 [Tumebacillus algifaecis]|uniref:AraC effector-binding domain-containing protein n=1 Tax=Tumebacillus algifaecis TaxID=1214604 RepID=A0A223D1L1_9BACL|nr:GyrI-like domain-containing protein [Tumebacillus algifaecis]ASS75441.1 hypothetical protein CIG75_10950 [Tumebacillus algifaecis]
MEPKFAEKGAFTIVGIELTANYLEMHLVGELWKRFVPRFHEVQHVINSHNTWGVTWNRQNDFTYVACFEVSEPSNLPEGMVTREVPGSRYAVFTHHGKIDTTSQTYHYAFDTWFKQSGYEHDFTLPSLELYDDRFLGTDNEESQMEIWLPIK